MSLNSVSERFVILVIGLLLTAHGCSNGGAVPKNGSSPKPTQIAGSPSTEPADRQSSNKCPAEYFGERYESDPGQTPEYLRCTDLHEKLDNAIIDGDLDRIKELISSGANVNGWYSHRFPPLYSAAIHGHKEIAEFLIENGALLDKGDSWGKTPLMAALIYNHPEVVKLLIVKGADLCKSVDSGTGEAKSALDYAVELKFREIEADLISAGAKNCPR